ncbi:MAG: SDR family NAD(P)-dependent oxidoreductase [Flavobacteriales bacterium]|nr:SDR family NAD(P)-dependent oxidoreductase [Flavobacteriales bacterium]MCC6938518.1 SDR family NAD(P)-dependent oxidoreductase [Flavobacteriales bacterium]
MQLSNNKILITGGASGIGFAMAERFVAEGNTVIICGRRADALADAAKAVPSLITRQCDLSKSEERVALFAWVAAEHGDTNVLVSNAGIQQWMSVEDDDFFQRAMDEININVTAPLHLTSLFLKLKSLTTIINVTSGLSFVPMVKTPVYPATKAFFHSFTVALRELVHARNIEVIEAIPPALNTDLGGKGLHDFAPPVSEFIASIFAQLKEGKIALTFGFTEALSQAGQEVIGPIFKRLNQLN